MLNIIFWKYRIGKVYLLSSTVQTLKKIHWRKRKIFVFIFGHFYACDVILFPDYQLISRQISDQLARGHKTIGNLKEELNPEISLLHMEVLTLIKATSNLLDTWNDVPACGDRKPKYRRLGRRHLGLSLTLWRHTVKRDILNMACDCWLPCSCVYWSLVKARKIVWES